MGTSCLSIKALTGANVYGVEPANDTYSPLVKCIGEFKLANPQIPYEPLLQHGESIPLPDESMDFIYSLEVLEHVQDPQKVLSEIYRLLKKGKSAYIATNNYDSFYEGHYKKFWNPFVTPDSNKRRYVKSGLGAQFFNELNFITKKQLIKYIHNCGFTHTIFEPPVISKIADTTLDVIYPEGYTLPTTGKNVSSTRLHKFIEKPKVAKFLSKFDREYKLYFLLEK